VGYDQDCGLGLHGRPFLQHCEAVPQGEEGRLLDASAAGILAYFGEALIAGAVLFGGDRLSAI